MFMLEGILAILTCSVAIKIWGIVGLNGAEDVELLLINKNRNFQKFNENFKSNKNTTLLFYLKNSLNPL